MTTHFKSGDTKTGVLSGSTTMSDVYGRKIVYPGGELYLMDCYVYITIDPSGGASEQTATARTDKCGWAVAAVDVKDNRFILEIGEKHLTDEQFVEHIYTLHDTYLPRLIGIEKTPHLDAHLRRAADDKKKYIPITLLKPRARKKSIRIRASSAALGRTYFLDTAAPQYERMFRNWYDEMEHGDDGLDAFAYLDDIMVPPTPGQLDVHRAEIIKALDMLHLTSLPRHVQEEWKFLKKYTNEDYSPEKDYEEFVNNE